MYVQINEREDYPFSWSKDAQLYLGLMAEEPVRVPLRIFAWIVLTSGLGRHYGIAAVAFHGRVGTGSIQRGNK